MADPVKKSPKKDESHKEPDNAKESGEIEEEYELMPHKDIVELREELRKFKSLPSEAGKHAEISFEELTRKIDKLIEIFQEAEKTVRIEEGAATFKEKMAPIVEKMNTILQQNSEIAEGIVALADIMNELKDKLEIGVIYKAKEAEKVRSEPKQEEPMFPPRQMGSQNMGFPGMGNQAMGQGQMMPPQGMMPPARPPQQAAGPMMPPPLPRTGAPMPPWEMAPQGAPRPGPMPTPPGMPPRKKEMF